VPDAWWPVLELARSVLAGREAWVVGGAVRDEFLCRPVVDLDIATGEPRAAGRAFAARSGGALFQLSERHGAWRVALQDGRTVDFTPLQDGIRADLGTRDFTINAIAAPLAGGDWVDPFGGGNDLRARLVRGVSDRVFKDDPLRLLRAVRIEDELEFRIEGETERMVLTHRLLVTEPAGERILGELMRLTRRGFFRLDELGLLEPLRGSLDRLHDLPSDAPPELVLVAVFGRELDRLPISNELRRLARTVCTAQAPDDLSARAIHRFRRATEPFSLEAVEYLGGDPHLRDAVLRARREAPAEPLVRGDELGLEPGPEIGRLLDRIEEERAAGTIRTREEALELARQERRP
jgi:tRNA nucleotidyltransferase/poly(A) polymerase